MGDLTNVEGFTVQHSSPPAKRVAVPGWLNARLVGGALLILLSTAAGARVVAAADSGEMVWAARHDLPAGYHLSGDDVRAVRVRLGDARVRYLGAASPPPAGYVLLRPVADGELVPGDALRPATAVTPQRRVVAVPLRPGHWPRDLGAGALVDVYATKRPGGGSPAGPATLVLAGVPVERVPGGDRGVFGAGEGAATDAELSVPADSVADLVTAVESGDVDLVRTAGSLPSAP